jgi:membrane-bound metal-dependent hydrolase YbcI (DUF457 family)
VILEATLVVIDHDHAFDSSTFEPNLRPALYGHRAFLHNVDAALYEVL